MTLKLDNPDLGADPGACWVMKDEVVAVEFAAVPGTIESAVGLNRYAAGDALLTGLTGDRWCVSCERFDAKYLPKAPTLRGQEGRYRNRPVPVLAKRMACSAVRPLVLESHAEAESSRTIRNESVGRSRQQRSGDGVG
ncbi:MAG: PGDYG domain-containing protein [Steroidobacteraceae bacterium]